MQPVRITPVDRLLTSLYHARQTGLLKPKQAVIEIDPCHPWNDRAFAVRVAPGQYRVLIHFAFNTQLSNTYVQDLQRHGFSLEHLVGVDYQDEAVVKV